MKIVRTKIDPSAPASLRQGKVDLARVDATTERQIAQHQLADDKDALQDAARFTVRVRKRLGLSQSQFSQRIDVPIETIRNWEQGKRYPTGAAKALLRVLDREPEAALRALEG
ncbi:helix-turn-helix domain-containing protein [Pusillimonas sp.]|uniref:helix-turn-helix domain-containing protein n=1 Tax=Pusillimonas sp. TaxID=3040095 RepID=UPI0037C8E17C